MTAQALTNIQGVLKETYAPEVPDLFEKVSKLYQRIKTGGDFVRVGNRNHRMAKKVKPGGQFRYVSLDGGDLGLGGAPIYDVATLTPLEIVEAIQWNKSVEVYSANNEIAVMNVFKDHLADAMEEAAINLDKSLNASATGVLETTVSGTNTTTWTVSNRGRGLRVGSRVTVYDSALSGARTSSTYPFPTVTAINPEANTIVVDGNPDSITNGDVILADGLTGATPTTLFGLKYHHNNSTSATWLSLSRNTYQNLRTPTVDASSASLTLRMLRLLQNKIEIARGDDVFDTGMWEYYGHQAQRHAYEELGQVISEYDKGQGDGYDGLFDVKKLRIGGYKFLTSSNADPTRLDLCDWKNWRRAETVPLSLYDVDDATTFQLYGTSGGLKASEIFYLLNVAQYYVVDPQRGGYISSLAAISDY